MILPVCLSVPPEYTHAWRDEYYLPRMFLNQHNSVYAYAQITICILIAILEYHLPANRTTLRRIARKSRSYCRLFLAAEGEHCCGKEIISQNEII